MTDNQIDKSFISEAKNNWPILLFLIIGCAVFTGAAYYG